MPLLMPGNILNNILKGKLGVASGWDTDPANLERVTDGDIDTVTGTGNKIMGGAGFYGYITFDLGSVKTMLLGARVGMWSTAGTTNIYFETSNDNITYRNLQPILCASTAVAEIVSELVAKVVRGRYVRLRLYVSAAATAYAKIYEIMAWELTL